MKSLPFVLVLILTAACSTSPLFPSERNAFYFPPELRFVIDAIDGDRWIHPLLNEPSGQWLRRHVRGIELDPSLQPAIGARIDRARRVIRWQPRNTPMTMHVVDLAAVVLHEARHLEGFAHTCGTFDLAGDRTLEEGGAFAVHILWLEHHERWTLAMTLRRDFIGCR